MTDDLQLRLNDITRPLARQIHQADRETLIGMVLTAFDSNGNVLAEALATALGGLPITWYLAGAVSVGTNLEREIELPAAIRLTSLRLRAKTPPSSSECTIVLTANGAEIARASIEKLSDSGRSLAINELVDAGTVLRIDCESDGGAADVSITTGYLPA